MNCSFCGKDVPEVRLMVKGPNANICEECVATCVEVMLIRPAEEVHNDSND